LITNGGKQAVEEAFATLLDPGDEVLLPAPYWTTYPEAIRLAGGVPVEVRTTWDAGFRVTIEQLSAARTPRTKVLLFVSPSNPTGAVYPPGEVEAIGRWAVENAVWVITDEIYEHLVYGTARFTSMPVVVPELADTCVVINGVAKTYAMTGWRVGWMIGPADVTKAAANLQSHTTSNVCNVAQRAALAAVGGDLAAVEVMRATYDRRRRTIVGMLNDIPGVRCPEPEGAFYAFPSMEGLLGRPLGPAGRVASTSLELAAIILEEARVAFVPGEAFGAPGYGRFSYALADEALIEGITRLAKLVGG
jgi:aspartate/methionine/tyrosine aminotransferase